MRYTTFSTRPKGWLWLLAIIFMVGPAFADETCQSPFLPKVTGQEDFVYVWTLGVEGVTDGNDSLVTVDVNPKSKTYGQIIHRAPVPGGTRLTMPASRTTGAICGPAGWTTAISSSSMWPQIRPSLSWSRPSRAS